MNSMIHRVAKRALDILTALLGLLFLALVSPWIAWRIRRESPGPVFYRAPRLGRHGRIFGMLKFRTMYDGAASFQGPRITAPDDPRLTPFGRWLRATKLNELPQFWNLLVGEMSLVGPRPEDPAIAAAWPPELRQELLSVRPGVTSPATILFIDEERLLDQYNVEESYRQTILPAKLRLDQRYVRQHSFWSDLDILYWTIRVLLPPLGRPKPPEEQFFNGPVARLANRIARTCRSHQPQNTPGASPAVGDNQAGGERRLADHEPPSQPGEAPHAQARLRPFRPPAGESHPGETSE